MPRCDSAASLILLARLWNTCTAFSARPLAWWSPLGEFAGVVRLFLVDILLDTVNVLDCLANDVCRVALTSRALASASMAEQRPRLAFTHHQHWNAIAWFCISTFHKAKVGAHSRYLRRLPRHCEVLSYQGAGLRAVWTPRLVVDVLFQCVLLELCLRRHLWMLHPPCPRPRDRVRLRRLRHERQRWLDASLAGLWLVNNLSASRALTIGVHVDLIAIACPRGLLLSFFAVVALAVIHGVQSWV